MKINEHDDQEVKQLEKTNTYELVSIVNENDEVVAKESKEEHSSPKAKDKKRYVQKYYPNNQIVGELNSRVKTRRKLFNAPTHAHVVMLTMEEPKDIVQASQDQHWLKAMNEELD